MRIVVVEYDPSWIENFNKEAALIRQVFGDILVDIHHIGSTSVPGLKAKPVIDMLPVVTDLAKVDQLNDRMIEYGYEPMGELGISGRRYFRKGGYNRTHNIHVFQADNYREILRHLAFRDYLRAHPEDAIAYGELKARLAALYPSDIESYMDGKDTFIKETEKKALEWYHTNKAIIR